MGMVGRRAIDKTAVKQGRPNVGCVLRDGAMQWKDGEALVIGQLI